MDAPCKDCTLRFPACHSDCPKDKDGGYGYKAWLADKHKETEAEKEWRQKKRDIYLHSEEYLWNGKKKNRGRR